MKRAILIVVWIFITGTAYCQQDPMFTHTVENMLSLNPAYAGSRDALTATLVYRSQWVGFKGAPVTEVASVHSPIPDQRHNFGLTFMKDKIEPSHNSSMFVDYAYRFNVTEFSTLAFGLKLGFNSLSSNLNELSLDESLDEAFMGKLNNEFKPNVGFGAYYSRDRFYAGFAIPKLFESNYVYHGENVLSSVFKERRHYYLMTGGIYTLSEDFEFKPSTLIKVTPGAPIQMDLTAGLIITEYLTIGTMYRTGDGFGAMAGLDVARKFFISYSYDWSLSNKTSRYNNGSHEILMRYDFKLPGRYRYHAPVYF
ncbi:type IX secretion system membrane protein PorP/SprF [Parabacteroides sp. FAFU027]|uniref:PorP/SprF family type IX secretion system membrane protein n=1 Tax=Parabacteroides sp. FAFU027 TaxID=2922715 RepID=UPI001FAF17AB|nr:type IX secretion system membrane protein PorP/SprF [Parabacteroides sp. FAFU027]